MNNEEIEQNLENLQDINTQPQTAEPTYKFTYPDGTAQKLTSRQAAQLGTTEELTSREAVQQQKHADNEVDRQSQQQDKVGSSPSEGLDKDLDKMQIASMRVSMASNDARAIRERNATVAPQQIDEAIRDMEADGLPHKQQETVPVVDAARPGRSFKALASRLLRRNGDAK